MKAYFRYFGTLLLLLLALFLAQRLLFLGFAHQRLAGIPWPEVFRCHWKALPMDVSASGYILLVVSALGIPLLFTDRTWPRRAIVGFLTATIIVSALINVSDIGLFDAWGTKIDRKALSYLAYPKEAMGSLSVTRLALLLFVALIQALTFIVLLRRIDHRRPFMQGALGGRIAAAVLVPGLCVVALRGGPQELPIDKSWNWFSRHPVLNLAALNGVWNALEIAVEPAELERNPYQVMPDGEAQAEFRAARALPGGTHRSIVKAGRPNILVILLESWTADVIEPLGGDSGVAPQFTRLAKDGLLFTNFHSTGFRTEQGLCATLSAFPSQPKTTIIRKFGKFDRLPSLVNALDSAGYASRYYYAGDVAFANTRAYLEAMGFDVVYDERSFPIQRRTRWGAFDEELFAFHLRDASSSPRPFFQVIMTATSHEPFDAPVHEGFEGGEAQQYRNTVHYTDRCLGAFLDDARKQDWYAKTLVVVMADHGHYLPHHLEAFSERRHRIPLLITGGALRDELRGTRDGTYGSHVDVAPTLLAQLGLPRGHFAWGRDLFDRGTRHDAFWTFNDGFGIADSTQAVVFDEAGQRVIELRDSADTKDRERLLRQGKAQLQLLIDQYMAFDQ